MASLRDVCGDVPVIEDAAHACGSVYRGKKAGNLGDIGCFSFQAVKNLSVGDGGALTLNNEELVARAKRLRWLGIDRGTWDRTGADQSYWWEYFVDEIGLKCHMNDINAALGLVQLDKLDHMNARRNRIADLYNDAFSGHDRIRPPASIPEDCTSSMHIYCARAQDRNELSVYLQERGIATGVHYRPIHTYRCYGNRPVLPNAEKVFNEILSLPMYPDLDDSQVECIINNIKSFYN